MRRRHLGLAGLGSCLAPRLAPAQPAEAWPARPVTILVPFVAGGPSDIVAVPSRRGCNRPSASRWWRRTAPARMARSRRGRSARSAPDGHTLMVGSIGVLAINAALRPALGYDPVRDFTPVTLAVTTPNVLVVNPQSVPARDLAGVIAWLRANPRAGYSTSGVGSSDHRPWNCSSRSPGSISRMCPMAAPPRPPPT